MDNCCDCHSEITRDGSGQLGRYLKALDPAYAPVDDRSIEDLLVFTKRYANQIRFYEIPGSDTQDAGDPAKLSWKEFFSRDMAVIAASLAIIDLEQFKKDYTQLRTKLDAAPAHKTYQDLFDPILGMAIKIDNWYSLAIPENPLHADLKLAIDSNLKAEMQKIVAYEEGFKSFDSRHPLNLDYSGIKNTDVWGLPGTVSGDISIYTGTEAEDKIRNAALFVDDIFNSFYGFLNQLVNKSESYMHFALEQYPAHQPHMALFIAFLKLFRLAQEQMNGITERMLDFYYRDVLQLTAKPAIPDKVHVVFELAKDVAEYDMHPGTSLKAGKDISGKEQFYKTEKDLVINQAKVKELKTIFIDKTIATDIATGNITTTINSIYARSVANSKDGLGEKFTEPNSKWPTFGKGNPALNTSNNTCDKIALIDEADRKDQAQIGLAIASPQFVLQGGKRLISIGINDLDNLFKTNQRDLEIWLTAEEAWLKIDNKWFLKAENKDKYDQIFKPYILKAKNEGLFDLEPGLNDLDYGYLVEGELIHIYLPVSASPVIPFDNKLHTGYFYNTPYPVMQIMIGPEINIDFNNPYIIKNISIAVKVGSINNFSSEETGVENLANVRTFPPIADGLKTLILQNDTGLIAAGKPFDPFTAYPFKGNSFYIGSNEVFNKPLVQLAINIQHVIAVADTLLDIVSSDSGKPALEIYKVFLREKKQWIQLSTENGRDFTEGTLTTNILFTPATKRDVSVNKHLVERSPLSYSSEFQEETYKGFIQIENNVNISSKEVKSNIRSSELNGFQLISLLAPVFKIKEISVSYYSELTTLDPEIDQFFHIYPFGVVETYLTPERSDTSKKEIDFPALDKQKQFLLVDANNLLLPHFNYLSPYEKYTKSKTISDGKTSPALFNNLLRKRFFTGELAKLRSNTKSYKAVRLLLDEKDNSKNAANQYTGEMQQGMLFIGLEKLKPLQSISMLFQFAEGSAENEDDDPPPINWSYLSYNEWRPLKAENIVHDGTYGFQTTGIIKIDVPADASDNNTIITGGLIWFCASVTENADRIPQLIDIVTQAVEAKFDDQANDQSHFDKALAAGSISKLAVPIAEVSTVKQPFASFDGKHKEIGKEFYTRVSERLRHKARAINAWDYEHLILDRFPSIYKVKCITNTDPSCLCREGRNPNVVTPENQACCGPQVAPGHVLIIPIANLKNRNAANPLQPKTSRRTLIAIQEYLKKRTSPFVHVHARNPVYEQIIVRFKVQFYSGNDKGFYMKKLNEEIVHFLTPWAFDENAEIKFNQKIYASSIINFIEERGYVDFITEFVMGVCCNDCCEPASTADNALITITVKDSNDVILENVMIKQKETDNTAIYDPVNKRYNITPVNTTPAVFLNFSLPDYIPQEVLISDKTALSITLYKFKEAFTHICNCEDINWILKSDSDFESDIVAKPCTKRSILVSVPQHIIIPYEPPEAESPCKKRMNSKNEGNLVLDKVVVKAVNKPVPEEKKPAPLKRKSTPQKLKPKNG